MTYLLGVDAGNSKTIALIADDAGRIVGAGRAGCGDIHNATPAGALRAIETAVRAALAEATLSEAQLTVGGFSMAGADWPEDFDLIEAELGARGYGRAQIVVNDAVGALRAGSAAGDAVAIVCGTGSTVSARSASGHVWHSSFWCEPDTGGRALGVEALHAVYRAELGILPPTLLTELVLALYGQPTVEELLHQITRRDSDFTWSAPQLVRLLLDAAENGDSIALQIVRQAAGRLGDYGLAAARQVGIIRTPFTLILAGGVFRHRSPVLADAVIDRVRSQAPEAMPEQSYSEPVLGALMLAFDTAGISLNASMLQSLTTTLPDEALFAT